MMKIKVLLITQVYLLICLLSGYIYEVMTLYLALLFHELGHIIMIKLFRKKISSLEISPLGGILFIEDCQNDFNYKEFLIYLGGPLFSFIYYLVVINFLDDPLIHRSAIYILVLNLLPIMPLDGSRLLMSWLQSIWPYKWVLRFSATLSILCCIGLIVVFKDHYFYVMILLFFMYKNLKTLHEIAYEYYSFLWYKTLHPNKKLKEKIIIKHKDYKNSFFKGFNHVFFIKQRFIHESELLNTMNHKKMVD
jgi:stage IV sporulation protein FB